MKKVIVLAMFVLSGVAFAHSGGTDRNGCHVDRKTGYEHCH